jgi:hypothetical protein
MKLQYTFIRQFLLRGLHPRTPVGGPLAPRPPRWTPRTLQRGYPPSALPRVEECTYFWGVNTSWGIDTAESKGPLHQEDNQAPQPTVHTFSDREKITFTLLKDLSHAKHWWETYWEQASTKEYGIYGAEPN